MEKTKYLEELKLAKEAANGSEKAARTILKNNLSIVRYLIRRLINKKEIVNELTLETFYKVFMNLNTYNGEYSLSTWIGKIAVNTAIDWLRHQQKKEQHKALPQESYLKEEDTPSLTDLPVETTHLMTSLEAQQILKLISNLFPLKYREAIRLYYMEGAKLEDIVKKTGISLTYLSIIISRTKNILRLISKTPSE